MLLNIVKTREAVNKKGGRSFRLSKVAKDAVKNKKGSRSFFSQLRTKYPQLKLKTRKKVDINRGFNVSKDMAKDINVLGIGNLECESSGVHNGHIDVDRVIVHDETPQFVNHGDTKYTSTKVFGLVGERCETLTKTNRECVTVQPFSNLAGHTLVTQVIFADAGLSSHMAPESTKNISNLLVSVNKSGVTDHDTLLAAYKELDIILSEKEIQRPVLIIADGHGSRFHEGVLEFLQERFMYMFILPPDTSGGTQVHDQMNAKLHSLYDQKKELLYTSISTLNRECFMNILSEAWAEFAAQVF